MKQSSSPKTRSNDIDDVKRSEHSSTGLETTNNINASPRNNNEIAAKVGRGARGTIGSIKGGDARQRATRGTDRGKYPVDEHDDHDDGSAAIRQDRAQIANTGIRSNTRRLSLSGSRAHLAQLKPKTSRQLLQRDERESSDSGVDRNVSTVLYCCRGCSAFHTKLTRTGAGLLRGVLIGGPT